MSLSTEGSEVFQQIQQLTAGLRNQVFPKIPELVIQQLWGPLALNGVSLVAAFATMAYIHFFSDSKLQFFKMHNIRGMSMPIPTIDVYLPLATIFSSDYIATVIVTINGAYDGSGSLRNLIALMYATYLPTGLSSWLTAGSLIHSSAEMLRLRRSGDFSTPHPGFMISVLYIVPTLFVASSLPILLIFNAKFNTAIAGGQSFVRIVEALPGPPSSSEVNELLVALDGHAVAFASADRWRKALCIEYLIWVLGFLLLFVPTALMMARTLKGVLKMEGASHNTQKSAEASAAPTLFTSSQRLLQLRTRYRFWVLLIILVSIWSLFFASVIIFTYVTTGKPGQTRSSFHVQVTNHWVNSTINCTILLTWFWKSVRGSSVAGRWQGSSVEAAATHTSRTKRSNAPGCSAVHVLVETSTAHDTPDGPLVVELAERDEKCSGQSSLDGHQDFDYQQKTRAASEDTSD